METLGSILQEHIPLEKNQFVWNLLYGPQLFCELRFSKNAIEAAGKLGMELKGYNWPKSLYESTKTTRVALFQNAIIKPTTLPVDQQRDALIELGRHAVEVASLCEVNVFCFQEIWNMPVAFCTQKKLPWVEFAEDAFGGPTTEALKKLAHSYNMVIISPILERDENDTLWNSAVVIDNHGEVLGISRKNHIPISGKFSEAYYYNPSTIGHPVFQTDYGRLAVAICYERHHPQCFRMYGTNGAEIVFNPSATVKTFSEHLWPIEARAAAFQNGYYTCAINRVGTETFLAEGGATENIGPFFGSSYISTPDGSRTPGLPCTRNGLLVCDLRLPRNE